MFKQSEKANDGYVTEEATIDEDYQTIEEDVADEEIAETPCTAEAAADEDYGRVAEGSADLSEEEKADYDLKYQKLIAMCQKVVISTQALMMSLWGRLAPRKRRLWRPRSVMFRSPSSLFISMSGKLRKLSTKRVLVVP